MEGERHDTKRQGEADGEGSAEEAMVEGRDGSALYTRWERLPSPILDYVWTWRVLAQTWSVYTPPQVMRPRGGAPHALERNSPRPKSESRCHPSSL